MIWGLAIPGGFEVRLAKTNDLVCLVEKSCTEAATSQIAPQACALAHAGSFCKPPAPHVNEAI